MFPNNTDPWQWLPLAFCLSVTYLQQQHQRELYRKQKHLKRLHERQCRDAHMSRSVIQLAKMPHQSTNMGQALQPHGTFMGVVRRVSQQSRLLDQDLVNAYT